jgi:hypothetical protein
MSGALAGHSFVIVTLKLFVASLPVVGWPVTWSEKSPSEASSLAVSVIVLRGGERDARLGLPSADDGVRDVHAQPLRQRRELEGDVLVEVQRALDLDRHGLRLALPHDRLGHDER